MFIAPPAALMIMAWVITACLGMFVARNMKTYGGGEQQLCGKAAWFQVETVFCLNCAKILLLYMAQSHITRVNVTTWVSHKMLFENRFTVQGVGYNVI